MALPGQDADAEGADEGEDQVGDGLLPAGDAGLRDRAAPPTASTRFLGLAPDIAAPRPSAASGVVLSMVASHLGICGCSSPWGRERNTRAATSSSTMPAAILTQSTQAAGVPDLLALPAPATASTTAPTMPRPISQPRTKTGPLTLARRLVSMSTTAMIAAGLSATPSASGSDPPIAWPIVPPRPTAAEPDRVQSPLHTVVRSLV
jgi:hypothetical protein